MMTTCFVEHSFQMRSALILGMILSGSMIAFVMFVGYQVTSFKQYRMNASGTKTIHFSALGNDNNVHDLMIFHHSGRLFQSSFLEMQ